MPRQAELDFGARAMCKAVMRQHDLGFWIADVLDGGQGSGGDLQGRVVGKTYILRRVDEDAPGDEAGSCRNGSGWPASRESGIRIPIPASI